MKRILGWIVAIAICFTAWSGLGLVAEPVQAAGVSVSAYADPEGIPEPDTVVVYATISNNTGDTITNVTISGNGANASIASISAGGSADTNFAAGFEPGERQTYTVRYTMADGSQGTDTFSVQVKDTFQAAPGVTLNVSGLSSDQNYSKGQKLQVTYKVTNTGNITLNNVTVSDPAAGGNVGSVDALGIGRSKSFTATITVNGDFTSKPQVTYSYDGSGGSKTYSLDSTTYKVKSTEFTVNLSADDSDVDSGTTVTFTCSIKNTGGSTISGITVTDDKGTVWDRGRTLAPGESASIVHKELLEESRSVSVTVKGSANGDSVSKNSNTVNVTVNGTSPTPSNVNIQVSAKASVENLEQPEKVSVQVTVTNLGSDAISNVEIYETGSNRLVETITNLQPGDKTIYDTVDITETTTLSYEARVKDATGGEKVFAGMPIVVSMGALVTPTPLLVTSTPGAENAVGGIDTLLIILGVVVVLIIATAVALVVLYVKDRKEKKLAAGAATGRRMTAETRPDEDEDYYDDEDDDYEDDGEEQQDTMPLPDLGGVDMNEPSMDDEPVVRPTPPEPKQVFYADDDVIDIEPPKPEENPIEDGDDDDNPLA